LIDMPLQNRVTPFGEIVAIPQRGLFTGNRGSIHDPSCHAAGDVCSSKVLHATAARSLWRFLKHAAM
jgi:hypothetical protein